MSRDTEYGRWVLVPHGTDTWSTGPGRPDRTTPVRLSDNTLPRVETETQGTQRTLSHPSAFGPTSPRPLIPSFVPIVTTITDVYPGGVPPPAPSLGVGVRTTSLSFYLWFRSLLSLSLLSVLLDLNVGDLHPRPLVLPDPYMVRGGTSVSPPSGLQESGF